MKVILVAWPCLALAGCQSQVEEPLPPIADISEMRAGLYNRPDAGPDIDEFVVLPEDYLKVLSLFGDRQLDNNPAAWQVLGGVTIKCEDGAESLISFYWTGHDRGAFKIDDRYYRGSEDSEIISVLIDCHTAAQNRTRQPPNKELNPSGGWALKLKSTPLTAARSALSFGVPNK
ncbi:MAG: hypothetical protein HUJ26_18260 [Planctomycetaceae bacterium]|nr:hypothetical protein [Planctomycetaceae bacterium]